MMMNHQQILNTNNAPLRTSQPTQGMSRQKYLQHSKSTALPFKNHLTINKSMIERSPYGSKAKIHNANKINSPPPQTTTTTISQDEY